MAGTEISEELQTKSKCLGTWPRLFLLQYDNEQAALLSACRQS